MISICNRIFVHPNYHEMFEQRFAEREALVDTMDGFLLFQILRPVEDGDPYVVMTLWESLDAFENWKNSEQFRQQHSKQRRLPSEALMAEPKIEIAEIIQQRVKVTD
jgi:heme-degrading monooxygenase HmoA